MPEPTPNLPILMYRDESVTCTICAAIRRAPFKSPPEATEEAPLEALYCLTLKKIVPDAFGCLGFRPADIFNRRVEEVQHP